MDIVKFIQENTPFMFAKFGDGEYYAAIGEHGGNCDGTPYTKRLGEGINESFKYLTQFSNVYIGKWADFDKPSTYFQSLTPNTVNWENYNILISRSRNEFLNRALPYFKAIRNANQQKIYICNEYMVEISRSVLTIDDFVVVDPVNWFEQNYSEILTTFIKTVKDPNNLMVLTSCGMGAKVLIADIHKLFPNAIFLDVGSSLDLVCSNRRTRDYHVLNFQDVLDIQNAIMS
jgi:hypothetical protein